MPAGDVPHHDGPGVTLVSRCVRLWRRVNEVLLPGLQCGSNSSAVLVQVKGWQRSFQPSMKVPMAVMRSLTEVDRRGGWPVRTSRETRSPSTSGPAARAEKPDAR